MSENSSLPPYHLDLASYLAHLRELGFDIKLCTCACSYLDSSPDSSARHNVLPRATLHRPRLLSSSRQTQRLHDLSSDGVRCAEWHWGVYCLERFSSWGRSFISIIITCRSLKCAWEEYRASDLPALRWTKTERNSRPSNTART